MDSPTMSPEEMRSRSLLFMSDPELWRLWPFLAVVRRQPGGVQELGLLFDALHAINLPGYSCTVFRANLYWLPATLEELLQTPKETYDTFDEVVASGWTVD